MPKNFLLSASSRGLGLLDVMRMSDAQIAAMFAQTRWPDSNGAPICPTCGMPASGPDRRGRLKCKDCHRRFTLTSGTAFHGRKLSLRQILVGLVVWAGAVKGMSALQVSRHLNVQARTAFVLFHKVRYALMVECAGRRVGGPDEDIEVDGCYIGGHVRPANHKKNRRDRRLRRNQSPKRRVVVLARGRRPGSRSIVAVVRAEHQGIGFLTNRIRSGSVVHADEAPSWNDLHGRFTTYRINHQLAYSDGMACTNQAESMFARLRRQEWGQHHRISGPYLLRYAVETAFREDHRRKSVFALTLMLLHLALNSPPDPMFRGYWQRGRRR